MDAQEWGQLTDEAIHLNETIHQSTRLRIMTLLVSLPEEDRFAYGFIQQTLDLTGGSNGLTTYTCAPAASQHTAHRRWPERA